MGNNGTLGIIADDMTGALMVAAYYETAGIRTAVVTDIEAIRECAGEAVVIWAGRTRLAEPDEAKRQITRAADAFDAIGCDQVIYKVCASFDSTEQGNVGPAADLLRARYNPSSLLFCPGFPKFNATVHQGYLFYRSRLISESVKRYDPATPMSDPDMVRFIGKQTNEPIGLLPHSVLLKGKDAAQAHLDELANAGKCYCVVDASDDGDVRIAAELARAQPTMVSSDAVLIQLELIALRPSQPSPLHHHYQATELPRFWWEQLVPLRMDRLRFCQTAPGFDSGPYKRWRYRRHGVKSNGMGKRSSRQTALPHFNGGQ